MHGAGAQARARARLPQLEADKLQRRELVHVGLGLVLGVVDHGRLRSALTPRERPASRHRSTGALRMAGDGRSSQERPSACCTHSSPRQAGCARPPPMPCPGWRALDSCRARTLQHMGYKAPWCRQTGRRKAAQHSGSGLRARAAGARLPQALVGRVGDLLGRPGALELGVGQLRRLPRAVLLLVPLLRLRRVGVGDGRRDVVVALGLRPALRPRSASSEARCSTGRQLSAPGRSASCVQRSQARGCNRSKPGASAHDADLRLARAARLVATSRASDADSSAGRTLSSCH